VPKTTFIDNEGVMVPESGVKVYILEKFSSFWKNYELLQFVFKNIEDVFQNSRNKQWALWS
jgi:hypothetical protein